MEDNRTEAQKALGIHPEKAEDKEKDEDAELDNTDTSEDEDEESEESSESPDEADKEDEDEEEAFKPEDKDEEESEKDESPKQTVPLKRLLDEKKRSKELENRISKLEGQAGEKASAELTAQMAKELNISPAAAQKLLEYSSKAVQMALEKEGRILTPELKKKLDSFEEGKETLDELTAEQRQVQAEKKEISYYNDEWNDFLPSLKKQYRNAPNSVLKEAAQVMYKLARSADYGNVPGKHPAYPLDYIFFKEKKAFDTILRISGKQGSGPQGHDVEQGDMKIDLLDPNLTPQQFQRYKEQQNAQKVQREKASGGLRFR